jgi:hypothetical protein
VSKIAVIPGDGIGTEVIPAGGFGSSFNVSELAGVAGVKPRDRRLHGR